ncbi:MAG: hypothetical protein JXB88_00425 [Spirochaetales bacterium]|nr:hypothetical protein [Spirochaetales bacterium]
MQVTTFETFVAFSEKRGCFLVKEKQFGPEGGGSFAFSIINAGKKMYERFEIANNFGTGNGHVPEKIPAGKCRTMLKKLSTSLSRSGFTGIDVYPESCETGDREKCFFLSQQVLNNNKNGYFGREGETLIQPPFSIQFHKNDLALFKNNDRLLPWTPEIPPDIKQMEAWMSPDNRLIVLLSFIHFNHHRITDVLFSRGDVQYKRLTFKDLKRK